ncbi:hypothetical protein NP493_2661g00003 [Ridgeia piscesae]|uniref:Uncharacterized protein n=1 Tax=Ridgeia piscesae TaxID=27915 RepID=A0AAD9JDL6_RIDPI|nr:hypothetical protein NP493_2661g00003 [Ridgeia piscesae]
MYSSDNLVLILAGCLAGLLVIGALGGFLFWLWYCKKRFNHIAPHVSQVGEKPSFSVSDPPPAYEEHAKHNTTTTHM